MARGQGADREVDFESGLWQGPKGTSSSWLKAKQTCPLIGPIEVREPMGKPLTDLVAHSKTHYLG